MTSGITNNGAIELTNINGGGQPVTLAMPNGTLVNAVGGTITSLNTGGATRTLAVELTNLGTLTVNHPLTVGRASAVHTNSGTIDVSGGNLTFAQSGTTPSLMTTGTVTIGTGRTFSVNGGAMTYNGGTIGGAGTLALNSATLNLTQSFSNSVTAFAPNASTINGPGTLTNAAGQTMTLTNGTINAPFNNQGLLIVPVGASTMNGAVTTAAGSMLRMISDGNCCGSTLTVTSGITNNGAIELTNINGGGQPVTLAVTGGALLNAVGGTISTLATGGGNKTISAQLNNQGTLNVAPGAAGSLGITGALVTSGILNFELGGTSPGSGYDQLNVNGTATLGGTLNVSLINAFTPSNSQTFALLNSTLARTGTFSTTTVPPGTSVQYNPNSVVLTVP